MKITFKPDHGWPDRNCVAPCEGASFVECEGPCVNADCVPIKSGEYLLLTGVKCTLQTSDRGATSDAGCVACGKTIGKLVVEYDTIFGAEEDERVLNGRPRVYR